MILSGFDPAFADCEYGDVLAELVHSLSQPLTALHGCLTAALRKPQIAVRDLQTALQQADAAIFLAAALRELLAGEGGGAQPGVSDASACLLEAVDDFLPVAESARVKIKLTSSGPCQVKLDAGRLRPALYYVVEFALNRARPRSQIYIAVTQEKTHARIELRTFAPRTKPRLFLPRGRVDTSALQRRVTLAMARRTFEHAAGSLEIRQAPGQITVLIRLPRVHQEPALPLAAPSRRCG